MGGMVMGGGIIYDGWINEHRRKEKKDFRLSAIYILDRFVHLI